MRAHRSTGRFLALCLISILGSGCATSAAVSDQQQSLAGQLLQSDTTFTVEMSERFPANRSVSFDRQEVGKQVALAWQSFSQEQQAEAVQAIEQARSSGADAATLLYFLGNSAARSGAFDDARAYYENSLMLNPSNARALYNLATVYLTKAEDHFNFYVASVADRDIDQALIRLLGDIESFSDSGAQTSSTETPLESLREMFEP